jgi:spoIIIJ-associated protein
MEKFIITTGKTIDLAVAAALEQLQMDRDSVSVEVLDNPKSGFLGIGASPARIKVTYEAPDEPPAPALSAASRSKPKAEPVKKPVEAPAAPKAAPAVTPHPVKAEKAAPVEKPTASVEPVAPVVYEAPAPGSAAEKAEEFLRGLLEHMGSDAVPHARMVDKNTCAVELVGSSLGMLIGRRGETLDAIQHLANYAVNHGHSDRCRINVDAENYRKKREEALERLAQKVAGRVSRYHRSVTLEPMNAYERHVIHAALQDNPEVTTHSTGTEPNRRVVVSYTRASH